jgi:putative endonuclease
VKIAEHLASNAQVGGSGLCVMAAARSEWFVYIARCSDNSLYTGVTTDINRRLMEHSSGKGAKYTRSRAPVSLASSWGPFDRSSAHSIENRIKSLSRKQKDYILTQNDVLLYLDSIAENK